MTIYYIATLARYVLVNATDEHVARVKGSAALCDLYADVRERSGRDVPIQIRTVRPATDEEIELIRWQNGLIDRGGLAAHSAVQEPSIPEDDH